ncbi:hypothetical protein [Abyssisolibacter fermentans]|uniref:hypothetical protein n=1 Tax=Abyssisolibacter fermentans TaxID=1766203 RepID=UPI00082F0E17|nr:hypothetical protein [Abyssisolibacter fermentans]
MLNRQLINEIFQFENLCKSKDINTDYLYTFTNYLIVHEELEYAKQITNDYIVKFLVYTFIRIYLDYTDDSIKSVINLIKEFVKWSKEKELNDLNIDFTKIEEVLYRTRRLSSMLPKLKETVNIPMIKFNKNFWLGNLDKQILEEDEVLTSNFTMSKNDEGNIVLKDIEEPWKEYILNKNNILEQLDVKNEVIVLEIYKNIKQCTWRIIDIGLIYPAYAMKYISKK